MSDTNDYENENENEYTSSDFVRNIQTWIDSKKNINKRTYYTVLFIQTKTENIRSIKLCLIMQILL